MPDLFDFASSWRLFGKPSAAIIALVLAAIGGTAQVGRTLTVSGGAWTNSPSSFTYQWKRNGVAIVGATATTYDAVVADQATAITCTITPVKAGTVGIPATTAPTAAVAAYDPLDMFATAYGAWWDPSDLSHMWQDTAGTVPVTTDGQSVQRIDDKSGNGLHLTQATGSKAPLYKTSGGLSWLQFDGVDDYLSIASVNLTAYFKSSTFAGIRRNLDDAERVILQHGLVGAASGWRMRSPSGANNNLGMRHVGATTNASTAKSTSAAPVSLYVSGFSDLQAPSLTARANGLAGSVVTTDVGGGNFANSSLFVGATNAPSNYFSGNIYQLLFVMKTASAAEIANVENHCRVKAGL